MCQFFHTLYYFYQAVLLYNLTRYTKQALLLFRSIYLQTPMITGLFFYLLLLGLFSLCMGSLCVSCFLYLKVSCVGSISTMLFTMEFFFLMLTSLLFGCSTVIFFVFSLFRMLLPRGLVLVFFFICTCFKPNCFWGCGLKVQLQCRLLRGWLSNKWSFTSNSILLCSCFLFCLSLVPLLLPLTSCK